MVGITRSKVIVVVVVVVVVFIYEVLHFKDMGNMLDKSWLIGSRIGSRNLCFLGILNLKMRDTYQPSRIVSWDYL